MVRFLMGDSRCLDGELATYPFLQTRRSGRDCRNPVAMDGCLGHFPVVWIPAIRAGVTAPWDSRLKPIGGEDGESGLI